MSINKVHVHLGPSDVGTRGGQIFKLQERPFEGVICVCGDKQVSQIVVVIVPFQ